MAAFIELVGLSSRCAYIGRIGQSRTLVFEFAPLYNNVSVREIILIRIVHSIRKSSYFSIIYIVAGTRTQVYIEYIADLNPSHTTALIVWANLSRDTI